MMHVTIELSLYPLADDFIPSILEFVGRLKSYKELDVVTNAASTLIVGEHGRVFDILSKETATTFSQHRAIFVMKVIGFERDIHQKY